MKKLSLVTVITLIGMSFILMIGCDDDSSSSSDKDQGSTSDPNYEAVSDLVGEGNFEYDMQLLNLSFFLVDEHFGLNEGSRKMSAMAEDSIDIITFVYDSSNYWHIFTVNIEIFDIRDLDTNSFVFIGTDSIRLGYPGGTYSYNLDTNTIASLDIRGHFNVTLNEGDNTTDIASHILFSLITAGGAHVPFTISGATIDSVMMMVDSDSGSCDLAMYFTQTINQIVLDDMAMEQDACPLSGNMAYSVNFDLSCTGTDEYDSLNVDGLWTATFTFANNMVAGRFENATTYWTFSDQCRGFDTVLKRWSRPFSPAKN
ncbi:MAG: hypothetical protein ABIJ45_04275 [Candidatus Zixiibacteriota bacterium]